MFVAPEKRRHGIDKALRRELIARLRRLEGVEQLEPGAMNTNPVAAGLDRAPGFAIYGTAPRDLKLDEYYRDVWS